MFLGLEVGKNILLINCRALLTKYGKGFYVDRLFQLTIHRLDRCTFDIGLIIDADFGL